MTRQINGKETYRTDEIEYLRWHAERRVADGRFALTAWGPVVSLIVLFTGLALTPPRRLPTSSDDLHAFTLITDGLNVIGPVLRIFAAVAALAFVAALVVAWRLQGDPKAKAFLERTRPLTPDPFT